MRALFVLAICIASSACASTHSVIVPQNMGPARVAVLTLDGELGAQAADLITQELVTRGVAAAKRDTRDVPYALTGTVTAEGGPLYSFPHVKMTLRLVELSTGQSRWIGQYGNSSWTGAISTQGDLERGAIDIVDEFFKSGAVGIVQK